MKKETIFTLISKLFGRSSYKEKLAPRTSSYRENIWGKGGRQAQMDSGQLMQRKPFTRNSKYSK